MVSEYGHVQVNHPVYLNRALREAGLLTVRDGPFGETLETFHSRAFAVCDHQLAHVYVADAADRLRVREVLAGLETHHVNAPPRQTGRIRKPKLAAKSLFANVEDPVLQELRAAELEKDCAGLREKAVLHGEQARPCAR